MKNTVDRNSQADSSTCVNKVVRLNIDSRDGFREAAKIIDDETLRWTFEEFANERDRQARELQELTACDACDPPEDGSYLAAFHRTWLKARSALSSDNTHAVLAEAERGEDQIKEAYEEALQEVNDGRLFRMLDEQYKRVLATHNRVRDLRDATA